VSFFAADLEDTGQERPKKPWWLATTSAGHGLRMAGLCFGLGAGWLIWSFFSSAGHTRIQTLVWLVAAAWYAISAVVVRRRKPGRRPRRP
jgi:hypothetical protein